MAEEINLRVTLTKDDVSVDKVFKDISNDAKRSGRQAGAGIASGLNTRLSGVFSSLTTKILGIGAALGSAFAVRGIVRVGASIEKIETQFTTLLGSTQKADKQIKELIDFAAKTPFQLEGLAQTTSGLLAFGFEAETIGDRLKVLGDVAAGSNSDLKEVGLIFGQVSAAGKLTGERLLQLQERAIPIGPALAKTLNVAESEVRGLVSAGKVGFKEFEEAFKSLTTQGGIFEGATERQSKTIGGLLSTLSDNFFALQAAVAKAFGPIFKQILSDVIIQVQILTKFFQDNSKTIVSSVISIARGINQFVTPAIVGLKRVGEIVFNALVVGVNTLVAGVGFLGSKLGQLLQLVGVGKSLSEGLIAFGETSNQVLEESITPLNESLNQIFDPIAFQEKTDLYLDTLEQTVETAAPMFERLGNVAAKSSEKIAKSFKKTSVDVGKAVTGALTKTISGAIQNATKALVLGEKGFGNFGQQVAATMGALAIQLGEMFIAAGIAIEATKALGGAGAIAAGAALIAVGTILSSFAGGESQLGSAGGSAAGGNFLGGEAFQPDFADSEEREDPDTQVSVVFNGDIIGDGEESAQKLVTILNEGFESQGLVFKGAETV